MAGVKLEWAQFAKYDSFDVHRYESPTPIAYLGIPIATGITSMYYIDTEVEESKLYYYRIVAKFGSEIAYSDEVECITGLLDQYWDNVVLLTHLNGNGIDLSKNPKTNTGGRFSTAIGDKKFGSNALLVTDNSEATNYPSHPDWGFAANQDFTVEYWSRQRFASTGSWFCKIGTWSSNQGFGFFANPNGYVTLINDFVFGFPTAQIIATFKSFAWVRHNGYIYLYIDGVRVATSATPYTNAIPAKQLRVGANNLTNDYWRGEIDEVRITKGIARYTGDAYAIQTDEFMAG